MAIQITRVWVLTVSAAMLCLLESSWISAATVEEIALMKSANREKLLVEGAKKEGKVVFYTGLIVDQVVRPVKAAFEKEYPSELKDPKGFWGSTNVYFMTLGYNTRSVKAAELPKSYEDLLNPRWKGQMMWATSRGSGAPQFIGNIFVTMGQEAGKAYLQTLKQQNIATSTASARQILDMVIAGEYPMAIQIFNHHAYISKTAGAPVDWQPLEPVTATNNTIGVAKNAPHPYATMLFIDFVLSRQGQKVFQASNYLPAHPDVPALQADLKPGGGRFKKVNYLSPDLIYDKSNEWGDYFDKEFLR